MASSSLPLFVFKKPLHSRTTDASGAQRIVYTFHVDATESLCGTYDPTEHGTPLNVLQTLLTEERSWLLRFVETFLTATKSYFLKPYSSSVVLRYLVHRIGSAAPPAGPVAFTPISISISQGQFIIGWDVRQDSIDIQIPDEEETFVPASADVTVAATATATAAATPLSVRPANTVIVPTSAPPVSAKATAAPIASAERIGSQSLRAMPHSLSQTTESTAAEGLSAVDTDALPYTVAGEVLSLRTPEQQAQERRRVREAHLRAKLAQYKAERTMTKYIQKYGDDLPYSSSESDWDTEGEEGSESE